MGWMIASHVRRGDKSAWRQMPAYMNMTTVDLQKTRIAGVIEQLKK